jgi:hypothetical protein
MSIPLRMFEFAFRCHHVQLSRVFTIKKRTYQVCFDCGQELKYSWAGMHVQTPIFQSDMSNPAQTQTLASVII